MCEAIRINEVKLECSWRFGVEYNFEEQDKNKCR